VSPSTPEARCPSPANRNLFYCFSNSTGNNNTNTTNTTKYQQHQHHQQQQVQINNGVLNGQFSYIDCQYKVLVRASRAFVVGFVANK
jgi:hypothetical protein